MISNAYNENRGRLSYPKLFLWCVAFNLLLLPFLKMVTFNCFSKPLAAVIMIAF